MVLCATRYCGKGKKVLLADQIFEGSVITLISLGLCLPIFLSDREMYMTHFATNDSIFTILNPQQKYSELEFYTNVAFDFENSQRGGKIVGLDSPQFKKIEPTYNQLAGNIRKRLPLQHPYRGLSQNAI